MRKADETLKGLKATCSTCNVPKEHLSPLPPLLTILPTLPLLTLPKRKPLRDLSLTILPGVRMVSVALARGQLGFRPP